MRSLLFTGCSLSRNSHALLQSKTPTVLCHLYAGTLL